MNKYDRQVCPTCKDALLATTDMLLGHAPPTMWIVYTLSTPTYRVHTYRVHTMKGYAHIWCPPPCKNGKVPEAALSHRVGSCLVGPKELAWTASLTMRKGCCPAACSIAAPAPTHRNTFTPCSPCSTCPQLQHGAHMPLPRGNLLQLLSGSRASCYTSNSAMAPDCMSGKLPLSWLPPMCARCKFGNAPADPHSGGIVPCNNTHSMRDVERTSAVASLGHLRSSFELKEH